MQLIIRDLIYRSPHNIMKKLLSLIIAVITFYGCQDDILSEEYQENVPATRASVGSSDYYYLV